MWLLQMYMYQPPAPQIEMRMLSITPDLRMSYWSSKHYMQFAPVFQAPGDIVIWGYVAEYTKAPLRDES